MNPQQLNEWRAGIDRKTDQSEFKLTSLVHSVRGGNGEKGLVHEVSDIKLEMAKQKGFMAMFAGVGSFLGGIIGSIIVAVLVKYVFHV